MQPALRIIAAATCAFSLGLSAPDANAVVGPLYAHLNIKTESEIIAGLDEPTRRLIMAMPEKVRAETVELIRQALPMLEQSTVKLLMHVDEIIEKNMNHLSCVGEALGRGIAEQIKDAVLPGQEVAPMRKLMKDWQKRTVSFKAQSAESIAIDYADFLHRAGVAACRHADRESVRRIEEIRAEARQKWRIWVEVQKECTTPANCLEKRYAAVHTMVKVADPRDIQQAGIEAAFEQVKPDPVPSPKPKGGSLAWFRAIFKLQTTNTTWPVYEAELERLRLIQRSLEATAAWRLATAASNLNTAISSIAEVEEKDRKAKVHIGNKFDKNENDLAKATAQRILEPAGLKDIRYRLELAKQGNRGLTDEITKQIARLDAVVRSAEQTIKSADENIRFIQAIRAFRPRPFRF